MFTNQVKELIECYHTKFLLLLLGLAMEEGKVKLALDRKPYTSLLYGNGVGFQGALRSIFEPHTRKNLTSKDTGKVIILFE